MFNAIKSKLELKKVKDMQDQFFGLADFSADDVDRYLEKYAETFKRLGE